MICYLYQDDGVFDNQATEAGESTKVTVNDNESKGAPVVVSSSSNTTGGNSTTRLKPDRARDRRDHISSMRSRAGLPNAYAEELTHGTAEMSLDPWGDGEHEAAAGFGSFGGAYGSSGKYDGAGLDRLMSLMAAARTLKLDRLQVSTVLQCLTIVLGMGVFCVDDIGSTAAVVGRRCFGSARCTTVSWRR